MENCKEEVYLSTVKHIWQNIHTVKHIYRACQQHVVPMSNCTVRSESSLEKIVRTQ